MRISTRNFANASFAHTLAGVLAFAFLSLAGFTDAQSRNPKSEKPVPGVVMPNVVYVDDNWAGTTPGTDPDGAGPATSFGYDAFATIQNGINGVASPGTVIVYAGTYDEDVAANKANLSLLGTNGPNVTTIRGPIGGDSTTVHVLASNVTVAGFTITRLGNNTTDWNDPGLNSAGIAVQGQAITGMLIHDNILTGNRTGVDVNNSNGHTIRNNVIDDNRTGLIFRNQTDNLTVEENFIANNWTAGIVFLDGAGGTNVPPQSALNSTFSNNDLSANWYGQIVDRQSGGSIPAPGTTNLKNFRGDWFGTPTPTVTTANSAEPGYAAQIPVEFGGTATPPGGQPDIAGPASANFKIDPVLTDGTDTNIETTPGRGTNGFQGVANTVVVSPADQHGWVFFDDDPGVGTGSGGFEHGPATAPLGLGSAYLQVDDMGRFGVATTAYAGTRMSDITSLIYNSYQNNNTNTVVAAALQFDIDYDLNDASNNYEGRLVFEPYLTGTVQQNVWQNWDAVAGKWYGTRTTVTVNGASVPNPCTQGSPCTWNQVLTNFPNAGVRNTPASALLFKAGGPWAPGFDGSVDGFTIKVNDASAVYDFEPAPTNGTFQFSATNYDDTETNSGSHTVTVTVTRTGGSDGAVSVHYATSDGSATTGDNDYIATSGDLNWTAGDTADKTFTVTVNGDSTYEPDEMLNLALSAPTGGAMLGSPNPATITILNDDPVPNTPPSITAATGVTRQQASIASNSTIATVNDTESGAGAVIVTVTSANPSNGVTISNIVNTSGTVTADVAASCSATNATFTLQASDGSLMATDTLNVTVTANPAPTLTYSNSSAPFNGSTTINPASGPTDNGSVSSIVVQSQGTYTGTISVDNGTGVISISNAAPIGPHAITIRATDNCGAITDATFTLTVSPPPCVPPNTVYVNASWVGTMPGTDPDGAGPATAFGCDSFATIQDGINGVTAPGNVIVYAGTYDEDVAANKADVTLLGTDGPSVTMIRGPIGGDSSTIHVLANNVTIAGFTITRLGNNTTDWNNAGLNSIGVAVQGQAITNMLVRDNIIVGNRTGVDVNNSNGHTIRNNIINDNRTGLIFRNQTDNMTVEENFISNNWTVGIVFLDGSGGTNVPPQSAHNSSFSNNDLSANWYGQIVDRQSGGSIPAPGTTNLKNYRGDWFGTPTPSRTTANSMEPGYAAQIPVEFGGTATPPGGQPDIEGPASDNFKIDPVLTDGTDTNIETTSGRGTFGFQGVANTVIVSPADQHGWVFFDDDPGVGTGSGGFEHGPGTPPLGLGSAYLQVDDMGRFGLATTAYAGTRMSDITALIYNSYQNNNANTVVAAALQFDIDYDLNDASNNYEGRLVFEPYLTGTVQQNVWQNWDATAGKWYGTRSTVTVNGVSAPNPCTQGSPCTWNQVLTNFPNAGVRNTPASALLFKAGGPWAPGFDGNVDAFTVKVNDASAVYDFEPTPTMGALQFSAANYDDPEGDSGSHTVAITVTRTGGTDGNVSVHYATSNGTATTGDNDYVAASGDLTWLAGDVTDKTFTVTVNSDTTYEYDETINLTLSTPTGGAMLGTPNPATITILNDDPLPPVVTITPATSPTATDNDYTRINNAVQGAFPTQTLKLVGTFDWTEPNAAASWAAGSNGIAGDLDDYSILVPAGLTDITFTADNLGDATIQGPGDLPALDLEGVFFFNGGGNQNWTISNIRFLDFDLTIGMFSGAGGTTAYNNTHITNNYIRMARDVDGPNDTFQNIGIYYSFGTNQVISGNTIDIPGDGLTTSGNYSADIAMQCDTSGGNVYNGLQITNNAIRILNAQSANPELIIGIWENAHGHTSNITISGNSFTNLAPGNNPTTNLQRAFRLTSHSSPTTTVSYENNTVSGANIGFQWLSGQAFAGNQAIKLTSNTITGNATGVLVQSQGVANLSFNRIVGNTATGLNNVDGTVTAENNWWGCNAGPGNGGCDAVTGTADFNPWIVLKAAATPNMIAAGGTSTVSTDMTFNSGNVVPTGTLPDMPVSYSATNGTMTPPTSTVVAGMASSMFTSTNSNSAVVSTTVDNETVNTPITITAPEFTIDDVMQAETNSGQTAFIFTVTKNGSTGLSSSVSFETQDGSATTADNDYDSNTGMLNFGPSDTMMQITVLVNGDTKFESNETFTVHLLNPSGATISDADGTGTITNDDGAPSFAIDNVTQAEGDGGTTSFVFTVTKTGSTALNSSVNFQTQDGTATLADNDYQMATGMLNFGPSDTTMQITVLVNGDTTVEPNETFTVHLSGEVNATITNADGLGTITNDDVPPPNIVYVDDNWVGTTPGTDPDGAGPATNFGFDAFATIQDGVNGVANPGTVIVYAGTYPEAVTVNKSLNIMGAQAGNNANTRFAGFVNGPNGPKADPAVESILTAASTAPASGANDTLHVMANNVTFNGFVVDGNNPSLAQGSATVIGGINTDSRRAIQTEDAAGNAFAANNVSIGYNVIQNFSQRGVELINGTASNTAPATSGNVITGNLVRNFGLDGIVMAFNAYADVTFNTVVVNDYPTEAGIWVQDFLNTGTPHPMNITNNNVTVGQDNFGGIWVNLAYLAAVNINNNTVNAAATVTSGDDFTYGIYVTSLRPGTTAYLKENVVGASGGQFDRGIALWNVGTSPTSTTVTGSTVSNSVKGITLTYEDPNFGPAGSSSAANINGVTVSGTGEGVLVDATNSGANTVKMTITNSTLSGNTAANGGGLHSVGTGGIASTTITNSTLSGNSPSGASILLQDASLTVGNSIFHNVIPGTNISSNGSSSVTSLGYNLSSDAFGGFLANTGDQLNTDPMLGPLKDNGGPTFTHAPLNGSPAIDKGRDIGPVSPAYTAIGQDQRNSPRPVTYDASIVPPAGGDRSDIGAVELAPGVKPQDAASWLMHGFAGYFPVNLPLSGPVGIECRSGGVNGDYEIIVTFAQPITFSNAAVTSGTGSVTGTNISRPVSLDSGPTGTQATINLTGVTNLQTIVVALFDVSDGANSGDVGVRMGVLLGDTTGDGVVNAGDTIQVRNQSGATIAPTNFRTDVNVDGLINAGDTAVVRSRSGDSLP